MLHHIEANIKIQRAGEPVLVVLRSESPAADLERWKDANSPLTKPSALTCEA